MSDKNTAYVYLHQKLDGTVFYVGVGVKGRAWSTHNRNPYWHRTVKKYGYEVVLALTGLEWDDAREKEIELIAHYRVVSGKTLTNMTDGGDGKLGYVMPAESRAKSRATQLGRTQSDAAKEKMRMARALRVMPPCSEETKEKIRAGNLKWHDANRDDFLKLRASQAKETSAKLSAARKGFVFSDEAKAAISAKISAKLTGRIMSQEVKDAQSKRQTGIKRPASVGDKLRVAFKGKTHTAEAKAKMSIAQKNKPPTTVETKARMTAAKLLYWANKREEKERLKSCNVATSCFTGKYPAGMIIPLDK